eukprot:5539015-Amphidinium_carterae.1
MAWFNPTQVAQLKASFEACQALGLVMPKGKRQPGGGRSPQTAASVGSKKWSAQNGIGWHCPSCKTYNFGFRELCYGCKVVARPAGLAPPTGKGMKPVPSSLSKPWEGLEHHLASEKDPEIRSLLQQAAALKKKQAAPATKELPVQDQRAKLKAQVRKLTTKLDKQQELLAAQHCQ